MARALLVSRAMAWTWRVTRSGERDSRRRLRASPWLLGVLALAAAAACTTEDPLGGGSLPPSTPKDEAPPATTTTEPASESEVGSVTIHRLNATEYDNTVFDLLGDDRRFGATFPIDNGAEGFTNNADALTLSPLQFEKYQAAAEKLAAKAVTNPKILRCAPTTGQDEACATTILARFLPRAWRRAVTPDEIGRLVALVSGAQGEGVGFADGVALALEAALLSPNFLFRIEIDPDPSATSPRRLNDYELASRLSYFLWSSMPDDALFAYAEAGKLSNEEVFDRQVRRMLADPKAKALLDNFASQWLLGTVHDVAPDATVFPAWSEDLRHSMIGETKAFMNDFLFGDQSLAGILDANYTYLDARMARYYGLLSPTASGASAGADAFVRVILPPSSHRRGLLTHASVLTMTSIATRTSPVRRGAWVLSDLLCSPPPAPPPDIPALEEKAKVGTIRERMEQHRENPVCASCHSQMDPIGFALEKYDAVGKWRELDEGVPIDATGQLPGGKTIDGAFELSQAIKEDPRFARCVTRKLYAYALGRAPQAFDEPRLAGLANGFVATDYRMRELILDIVYSDAFRMRRPGGAK